MDEISCSQNLAQVLDFDFFTVDALVNDKLNAACFLMVFQAVYISFAGEHFSPLQNVG